MGDMADAILDIIRVLPDRAIKNLLDATDAGKEATKHNIEEITGVSGEKIGPLRRIIADPSTNREIFNAMLVTGLRAKSRHSRAADEVEIVWTGPSRISAGVRNTRPVIEEMLKSAQPGERVTIIDYKITSSAGRIVDELNACLRAGVKIDLIVDKNKANERELRRCFARKDLARPTIYTRKDSEPKFYKVHAKVIIVGCRKMLVSSANLTGLGTEVNFEIGLLVSGPTVKKMHSLIKRMIDEEYFVGDQP